ncbi:MAG: ArsR family transcriptional regulator [Lysobacteraceae bacterium SCN 69-48]|nr:MAG: ArsR family transcriptional regulator [Xanthomonadaceae bacterium SCN 69-48]
MKDQYNILFLCTGNSARSQMAEALAKSLGGTRLRAYSAGSQPAGAVHPQALQVMQDAGIPTDGLRSKSWNEFAGADAPEMDLIITVCDRAAGETCPVWPGHPLTAHWNIPDPVEVTGSPEQIHKAFAHALHALQQRISLLLALKMEALGRLAAETKLRALSERPIQPHPSL